MRRKGPLPGKICALCIPERRFAGLFGCMARISCQNQLVSDAWRRYVAREGRFSRPGPLRECMKQENCHEKAPENASAQFLATARRPRTHRARILPRMAAHGRTTAKYRRRRTLGDAIREHFAIGERRGMHQGIILPRLDVRAPRPTPHGSRSAHGAERPLVPCHSAMYRNVMRRSATDARAERSRPCPTRPTLMPPPRPPRHYGTMRRTRRFCRR